MSWDFWRERKIKASRRDRLCGECETLIAKGEPYLSCVGTFDGEFSGYDAHEDCLKWAQRVLTPGDRPCLAHAEIEFDVDLKALKANPCPAAVRARLSKSWQGWLGTVEQAGTA